MADSCQQESASFIIICPLLGGVVGHCGVAYDFWFPLELSFDYRPNIGAWFGNGGAGFYGYGLYTGITLGVRYKF